MQRKGRITVFPGANMAIREAEAAEVLGGELGAVMINLEIPRV